MIICKLSGGIGNQLFQYFNALSISKATNRKIYLDISSFKNTCDHSGYQLDKYGVEDPILPNTICNLSNLLFRIVNKFFKKKLSYYLLQENFNYEPIDFNHLLIHLDGTFQSQLFFSNIFPIADEFLSLEVDEKCKNLALEIDSLNSISIHIRRGDYVNNEVVRKFIGPCSLEYYQNAIKYMEEKFNFLKFYIFTDDVDWVKKNIRFNSCYEYVDFNCFERSHFDISLMRKCKHNIISNSSFSWMGAWKPGQNHIVICPSPWFNDSSIDTSDICPKEWIRFNK
ncbi:alpha-1,2-fucosyltransferase [Shewanella baltica]|uniref:alpha-1,2-fucosyltransferase n=1 Tax=Shewanella baltica TaxID=62322 RepID=UPI003D78DCF3